MDRCSPIQNAVNANITSPSSPINRSRSFYGQRASVNPELLRAKGRCEQGTLMSENEIIAEYL
jgi:hypothetical protein